MKKEIHPTYFPEATVTCACGNSWTTGSTQEVIRTDICYKCHPFFTGEQRIVDTEGQVDRFMKKLQAREEYLAEQKEREEESALPQHSIADLELGARSEKILAEAGITEIAHVLDKLESGEKALLDIKGFGRKSLADLKKGLRRLEYDLPEAAQEISV
jgi:large subunit ribosomal protein L31